MTELRDRIATIQQAHYDAELVYDRLLRKVDDPDVLGKSPVRLAAANAHAEGLAEAIAILAAKDVVDVRATVRADIGRVRGDGLSGADDARRSLRAHSFDVV